MVKSKQSNKNFEFAVNNADYDTIVELAAQHRSKKNNFSFGEQLKSMKEDELVSLMKQLLKILMGYIKKNFDENASIDWTVLSPEQCKIIGLFIQAATDIGLACIQNDLTPICQLELLQIAVFLHSIMLPMPDKMDNVKNSIAHLCEKLFLTGLYENGEIFLDNIVLYLVRKTLAKRSAKTDVKRLYAIRKIIPSIMRTGAPNTAQLWSLFSACVISLTYLSILEGQKLIALILTLDRNQLLEMHEKIKNYVAGVSVKNAVAYGKVYFEGWCYTVKSDRNGIRDTYELKCLQDLIIMSVEYQRKHTLPIIRKILNHFFIHKKEPEVSRLLYGVFQPLIWRYIKNPSGLFRACATQLFLDIFPLEDPEMRVVRNDMEVNEQLLMIRDLLTDEFPIVRVSAVLGICLSMSVNWEVFPEEILKTFFRIIVDDLSWDSAHSEVRLAVVKGLKCLLENPLAIRCLVGILPKVSGLFHDTSENVRLAFCQLLLKVKSISAIKYFDIVPVKDLMARMEEDSYGVKKCLCNLLLNSYFPKGQDPKVWLGRCLEMIKTDRYAARVFFSNASSFIGVESSVKFMTLAAKAIHIYVRTKSSSGHIDMEISDKENIQSYTDYITTLEDAVGFNNLKIVSSVMEAIAIMWLSLKLDPEHMTGDNKSCIKMLVGKLGGALQDLCFYYKGTEAWEAVFYLSSFIPVEFVPSLGSLCFMRLKNLPPDAQESDYLTLLECLANHFQTLELINVLKEWIEAGLSGSFVPPPAKKKRGRKKSGEGIYQDQIKPYLANRILHTLLHNRNLQKRVLLERSALQEIMYLADNIKKKLVKVNARLMTEAEADFLNLLTFNIIKLSVHLHDHPYYDQATSVPFLNDFVKWTSESLVPQLNSIDDEQIQFTILILRLCENLCKVLGDVTSLGFYEPDSCLYLEFIYLLLDTNFGYEFLLIASRFLYKHAAHSQFLILMDNDTIMMQHHLDYLNRIFVLINNDSMLEKLSEKEFEEITFTLANVMQIVHNHVNKLTELSSQVFRRILKNILDCTAEKCVDTVQEMAEDPFDRLSFPKVGNFFSLIISHKPKLIRTYVKYLIEMFKNDSQDIDISMWIAYWMILWNFLHTKSVSQPVMKEIHSLVLQLEKCLHHLYPRGKDSEQNNLEKSSGSVPLQLFQHHCYAELIKLKNRVKSKLRNSLSTKK